MELLFGLGQGALQFGFLLLMLAILLHLAAEAFLNAQQQRIQRISGRFQRQLPREAGNQAEVEDQNRHQQHGGAHQAETAIQALGQLQTDNAAGGIDDVFIRGVGMQGEKHAAGHQAERIA